MSITRVVLVFTFVLLALAMALPQMAFAQGAGRALEFDGSDDYVNYGPITDFSTISFTWEVGVKGSGAPVLRKHPGAHAYPYNTLRFSGSETEFSIYQSGTKFAKAVTSFTINDGQWHHLAGT